MKKVLVFFLLFCMLFCSGCIVKNVQGLSKIKDRNSITYNIGEFPKDLNQLDMEKERQSDIFLAIFEGLVKTDLNGEVVPGLAESWTVSKDGLSYKFRIKNNALWSDGTNITARDINDFFLELLKSDINNSCAYQLYCIFGAEEYQKGKKDKNQVAINCIDDKNIEFRLNSPNNKFLNIISQPSFSLRKIGDNLKSWTKKYMDIKYTGPFKIDGISSDGEIKLLKNKYYWDNNNVIMDKLILASTVSSEKALADYETSKIDVMVSPPFSEVKRLIDENKAYSMPTNILNSFIFNLKSKSVVKDIKFRKAISLVVDRDSILKSSIEGLGRITETFLPSTNLIENKRDNEEQLNNYKKNNISVIDNKAPNELYNISEAKLLLKQAKYNNNNKIRLVYLNSSENKKVCEAFKKFIHDSLDVNIECNGYEYDSLKEICNSGEYEILKKEYSNFYDNELSFLQRWSSNSNLNIYGYRNPNFDSLLKKLESENDNNKSKQLIKNSQEILANDIPEIPFYFSNLIICKDKDISGIDVTSNGNLIFNKVYYKTPQ